MTTLISVLGKKKNGYSMASYRFDNGVVRQVPFFGLALADHLKPQRLILLGTRGSMWDVFFDQHGELDHAAHEPQQQPGQRRRLVQVVP